LPGEAKELWAMLLGGSAVQYIGALLRLLGLAVLVYVVVPLLKTVAECGCAQVRVRLMPPGRAARRPSPRIRVQPRRVVRRRKLGA
jgi:hypothetical protein